MNPKKELLRWLNSGLLTKNEELELSEILNDKSNIKLNQSFNKHIQFGTGGLRGEIGLGINNVNRFTICRITQGIANYINDIKARNPKNAVIAYDTRHLSKDFALYAARVFAANDIFVSVFADVTPTPILSFAIRQLNADIGIVITASHNPKEYNGYKVYNKLGSQITDNDALLITRYINLVDLFIGPKTISLEDALKANCIKFIGNDIYSSYYNLVISNSFKNKACNNLNVLYTSLHGSGLEHVKNLLTEKGFNLQIVDSQSEFNGSFPTVSSPNPEEKSAFNIAVRIAKKLKSDLILGTDPDADRLGVVVRHNESYIHLTGNEIGIIILSEIIKSIDVNDNDYIVKTIVTSDLGKKLAMHAGVKVIETLTGFKYIGEKISELKTMGKRFLFGYEESFGYLKDDYVRDKDAVMSSLMVCDIASRLKAENKTLIDLINEIYAANGYYKNSLITLEIKSVNVSNIFDNILKILNSNIEKLNRLHRDSFLEFKEDYSIGKRIDLISQMETTLDLPYSNVVKFIYSNNSWFAIRPSGTESKIKIYIQVISNSKYESLKKLRIMETVLIEILDNLHLS